jgi:hypothetical protein
MEDTGNLDRLCGVYWELNDDEKGEIVRLAEGLLNDQNSVSADKLEEFENEGIGL